MPLLKRDAILTLTGKVKIEDMFAYGDTIYYLARSVSQEELVTAELANLPLMIVCVDSEVKKIPDEVIDYARNFLAGKYGEDPT